MPKSNEHTTCWSIFRSLWNFCKPNIDLLERLGEQELNAMISDSINNKCDFLNQEQKDQLIKNTKNNVSAIGVTTLDGLNTLINHSVKSQSEFLSQEKNQVLDITPEPSLQTCVAGSTLVIAEEGTV